MFSEKEVKKACLEYFNGDEIAADKWMSKYCLKNDSGEYLEKTPDDMHRRLAREFERIEENYPNPMSFTQIYELLKDFKYIIPQGSPMYGIGNNNFVTSLSNCFVIGSNDNSDSYGSIMRTDEEQVQLMKRRGGVGHDISHLRPSGSLANNSALGGNAGAVLYMERFSHSTREVSQDGRRGALMLSISVKHPDAERFIDIKMDTNKVTGANVSVKITNEFMNAVKSDRDFIQCFPIDLTKEQFVSEFPGDIEDIPYNKLIKGVSKNTYCKKIKARKLWDKIIYNAWRSAEPGVLFWDKVIEESPADCYEGFKTVSTNPCGEISLCPYDSCRLLAINLYSYVENKFTSKSYFNWSKFIMHVFFAQRLMDDLVDLEIEKLDKIIEKIYSDPEPNEIKSVELSLWEKVKEKAIQGRRTGLGITAEGDMLAALGLKYGTKEATEFSVSVHKQLAQMSYESSIHLAEERGCFPVWDFNKERDNPFISRILNEFNESYDTSKGHDHPIIWKYENVGRRNISNLTIAPTGTTSLMSQTTSGIEPLFTPFYTRRTKLSQDAKEFDFVDNVGDKWSEYKVYHVPFIEWYRTQIINKIDDFYVWYDGAGLSDKEIVAFLNEIDRPLLGIIIEASPYYKATSNDVDYFEKVRMQGEIQKWVDHSISVTINMPEQVPVEVVSQCYELAYDSGCKGMTVYRDNSRSGVLIKNEEKPKEGFKYNDSFKRPKTVKCDIYRKTVLKKDWMIVVGLEDSGKPIEIFAFEDVDNITFPKVIQKGEVTKIQSRIYQLKGEYSGKTYILPDIVSLISIDDKSDTRKYSLMLRHGIHPKYIVEQIEEYATIVSFDKAIQRVLKNYLDLNGLKKNPCPVCGLELMRVEGCEKCSCGYSRC